MYLEDLGCFTAAAAYLLAQGAAGCMGLAFGVGRWVMVNSDCWMIGAGDGRH